MQYIWDNKDMPSLPAQIQRHPAFLKLQKLLGKDCSALLAHSIGKMLNDVKSYNQPPYVLTKDEKGKSVIGYKEFGSTVFNISYGYKTAFAHLKELENKAISPEIARQALALKINCGQFSYAELPKQFSFILGVTGTLTTLGSFEKDVLTTEYEVKKQTVMPSIYGPSNLRFKEKDDVYVETDEVRYHQKILSEILEAKSAGRAVLVFFSDESSLRRFADSGYGKDLGYNDFSQSYENIDFYVRKAVRSGEVSLLPRVYGRGMDFVCRDPDVEDAGGVHVIQTFLSEELSEEVQTKGRTARQGRKGSFMLVLYAADLEKGFAIPIPKIEEEKKGTALYSFLNQKRNQQFDHKSTQRKGIIERSSMLHKEAMKFKENWKNPFMHKESQLQYLLSQNRVNAKGKIICISDATGSMKPVWTQTKEQIFEMLKRIETIGGAGRTELMWVAYRDYCDKQIVESSDWESDPNKLMSFIKDIKCYGGGDGPEAVEMALQHANGVEGKTRVILIADAEPHLEGKGNLVKYHKKTLETDYICESEKLRDSGVPVYCFYMKEEPALVESFITIATITGGKAAPFKDTKTLMDIIAENVLHDLGGNELVQEYRKTYHS